jgi:molybdate transport system ATP-binding protein
MSEIRQAAPPVTLAVDLTIAPGPGRAFALRGRFEVPPGITVLSGPSGCGKSTTLAALAGLVRPDQGRIALGSEVLFDAARELHVPAERRHFGLVFQSLALFPHLTALHNVAYGVPGPRAGRAEVAAGWLERMRVTELAARRPSSFSGGEAQRVALARALASQPRVLLLDEPFSALDEELRTGLGQELQRLVRELRLPTLLVTHDRRHGEALADRWLSMRDGAISTGSAGENVSAP